MYLPATAQDRLFEQITELSAPAAGSRSKPPHATPTSAAKRCESGSSASPTSSASSKVSTCRTWSTTTRTAPS
ncbi:putative S-adenosyl-L-methionine-dependent methyltransferase [Mycobacterium xenopi 3993]|nr:putative S-adenosyl-L-methionine-dependent methyltransferase [Mycobacterium xenopi 3993]